MRQLRQPASKPSGVIRSGHILWLLGLPLSRVGFTKVLASSRNWSPSMESSIGEQAAKFAVIRGNTAHLSMANISCSLMPTSASTMHAMIASVVSLGVEDPLGIAGNL